jgi:hypothetical protein
MWRRRSSWQDLDTGKPGGVVERDVHDLPTNLAVLAVPITDDVVADPRATGELLGVEMDQLAGLCAVVGPPPAAPRPSRARCLASVLGGRCRRSAIFWPAKRYLRHSRTIGTPPPRAAVVQASQRGLSIAGEPAADGPLTGPECINRDLANPPFLERSPDQVGSTERASCGILVHVHPGCSSSVGVGSHQPPDWHQPG